MKRFKSWLVIIVITLLTCAAFAFLFIGAWWNTYLLICLAALIWIAYREW